MEDFFFSWHRDTTDVKCWPIGRSRDRVILAGAAHNSPPLWKTGCFVFSTASSGSLSRGVLFPKALKKLSWVSPCSVFDYSSTRELQAQLKWPCMGQDLREVGDAPYSRGPWAHWACWRQRWEYPSPSPFPSSFPSPSSSPSPVLSLPTGNTAKNYIKDGLNPSIFLILEFVFF